MNFKPEAWMRLRAKNGGTMLMLRQAKANDIKKNHDCYSRSAAGNRNLGWRELERKRDAIKKKKEDLEESMRIIKKIKDAQMRKAVRHRKSLKTRPSVAPSLRSHKTKGDSSKREILVPDSDEEVE